jgi:hypothetical protein
MESAALGMSMKRRRPRLWDVIFDMNDVVAYIVAFLALCFGFFYMIILSDQRLLTVFSNQSIDDFSFSLKDGLVHSSCKAHYLWMCFTKLRGCAFCQNGVCSVYVKRASLASFPQIHVYIMRV